MTHPASRLKTAQRPFTPRALASAVALALAALTAPVDAAGLGRLTVQSGLGQPLRAEIEVTSLSREEAATLSARLASGDAFRQAGLEYNPALRNLRFAVEPRGGRTFIKITSAQPINEPFVDLLVELNWATGKFVREYTFLLDPPEMRTARETVEGGAVRTDTAAPRGTAPVARPVPVAAAPVAQAAPAPAPAPVAAPVAQAQQPAPAAAPAPRAAAPAPAPAAVAQAPQAAPAAPRATAPAAPAPSPRAEPAAGTVQVARGDTLGNIARGAQPEGVSLDQAMIAIYRANRGAFINNNINLVREGARLDIPDRATMAGVDATEARREVRLQAADFNAYRQRLAAAPAQVDAPRAGQTAAGTVGGRVDDRSAAAGRDRLELSRSGAAGEGAGGPGTQASRAGAEQSVAREAALKEANSRVADLEKNVADLQRLLELKNRSLADLQKQIDDARASTGAVTGQVATAPVAPPAAPKAEAPKVEAPKVEAPKLDAPKGDAPAAEAPRPAPAPKAEAPKAAAPVPAPAAGGSFLDDLLENPFVLPGVGLIALLGAGYGWYAIRRRRRVEKFEDSLVAADGFTANSLFGSTGGQSVDTSASVFSGAATAGSVDVHSTEVDPIAEADVYIAYGREAQAEEILREALKRQPERQAIRAKLLEIHAGRKDAKAFEAVAREMHDMTGGENEEWPKVVTLGLSIDPTNPLYGGGSAGGAATPQSAAGAPSGGFGLGAGAAAAGAAAMAHPLDFPSVDLPPAAAPVTPAAPVAEPVAQALDEVPSLDFDLDFNAKLDAAASADGLVADTVRGPDLGTAVPAELSPSIGSFDLPSLDLDEKLPSAAAAEPPGLDLDLGALERLTEPSPHGGKAHLDLSPISLDLEPATVAAETTEAGSGRWQEMATKLDLASAYEEIGDKEGARELLQEVVKGGDSGQQQKARAMLVKIG